MEDYEEHLYGVEDDFHNQFAAELEVLAELEGGCGSWVSARSRLHPAAIVGELRGWDRQWLGVHFLQYVAPLNLCLNRDTGPGALWEPPDSSEPPPIDV